MDFGLKFEVIKALQKALNEFLRIVGGGVQESHPQASAAVKRRFLKQSINPLLIRLFKVYSFPENIASTKFESPI